METFLQDIGKQLQEESRKLTEFTEPEHKALAVRAFECMAGCFKGPGPAVECRECASKCNDGIQKFQQDLEQHVKAIQNNFQSCMQTCALKIVKNDAEELKACVNVCMQTTLQQFQDARTVVKELISKYQ